MSKNSKTLQNKRVTNPGDNLTKGKLKKTPGSKNKSDGKSVSPSEKYRKVIPALAENIVEDPAIEFIERVDPIHKISISRPADKLVSINGKDGKSNYRMTTFEKMKLIDEGISKKVLLNLKEKAKLDYDQLSKVLNVARATLINKKGNETFSKDVSDKILGLSDIYAYGYEVFEDQDRFNGWIFRENRALGGKSPFDFLHNSFGREEIKHLIGRIEYGIYS